MNQCIKLCVMANVVYLVRGISFRDVSERCGLSSIEALGQVVGFGDFNKDRVTDILLTNGTLVWMRSSHKFVLEESHIPSTASRDAEASVTLLDVDRSGSLDAVVAQAGTAEAVSGDAQEGIVEVHAFLDMNAKVKPVVFQARSKPVVIDYDGNHQLELLALDPFWTWTIWSWNDTANNLTHFPFGVALGSSLEQVLYADIDGDCAGDVVGVGYYHGNKTSDRGWHLTVWPRTPEGTFSSSSVRITLEGSGSHFVHLMDVDADGGLEVLSAACSSDSLQLTVMSFESEGNFPLACQSRGNTAFTRKVDIEEIANISCNCSTRPPSIDSGDIDLDGYPEVLLTCNGRVFLFLNSPCDMYSQCVKGRTLSLVDTELSSVTSVTQALFFDLKDDGVLDVLMSRQTVAGQTGLAAFELVPTEAHMFVKVYVPSGDCRQGCSGASLPGAAVSYVTHDRYGQLQRSTGHFWSSSPSSPALPYVVLGLGKAPNFIEDVSVGVFSREARQFYKRWARLIPNSQIRVLCTPVAAPDKWQLQLYLTPSDLVWISSAVMAGVCVVVGCLVLGLHLREKFIDAKKRKKEPVQFVFDPM